MMGVSKLKEQINEWLNISEFKSELESLTNAEIENRFNHLITFGTGGMRAIMEAGTNRMNIYTVRLATTGLAKQIIHDELDRKVVIAYDTRINSERFAKEAAQTLLYYGIDAYLFKEARPTPMLSFAVRHYKASAGIMITASHNPKAYNGYKLYGKDGGQLTPEAVGYVKNVMEESVSTITELPSASDLEPTYILDEVESAYQKALLALRRQDSKKDLSIVYTPLHGTGLYPITQALKTFGYDNVHLEPAQAKLDGSFPTVDYPNPEEQSAFHLAEQLGQDLSADILIATDPDADRLGVAIRHNNNFVYLSGNQLGALLLNYKLTLLKETNELPANGVAIKTIVTSELGRKIAASFGVEMEDTLTGFKYISEKIEAYTQTNKKTFLFGYEESYGYLLEDFARDKDAIQAALAVCEMAEMYKQDKQTLIDALNILYETHGYHKEKLISIELDPLNGNTEVTALMDKFMQPTKALKSDLNIRSIENYLTSKQITRDDTVSELTLPKENVVKYHLADQAWLCFRPSGTEPKMKVYIGVVAKTDKLAQTQIDTLENTIKNHIAL